MCHFAYNRNASSVWAFTVRAHLCRLLLRSMSFVSRAHKYRLIHRFVEQHTESGVPTLAWALMQARPVARGAVDRRMSSRYVACTRVNIDRRCVALPTSCSRARCLAQTAYGRWSERGRWHGHGMLPRTRVPNNVPIASTTHNIVNFAVVVNVRVFRVRSVRWCGSLACQDGTTHGRVAGLVHERLRTLYASRAINPCSHARPTRPSQHARWGTASPAC